MSSFPDYAIDRKVATRDCAVWGEAHSRHSTTEELDLRFEREFRKTRTTPPA